jgi:hypothetical protein
VVIRPQVAISFIKLLKSSGLAVKTPSSGVATKLTLVRIVCKSLILSIVIFGREKKEKVFLTHQKMDASCLGDAEVDTADIAVVE